MASAHQARGRSRNQSIERNSHSHSHTNHSAESTPKAGTKRLFSNRESRQPDGNGEHADSNAELNTADGGERHSDKRHRSSDWPLSNPSPSSISSVRHHPQHTRKSPNTPSSSRRSQSQIRPSKFVEGSMNDRVSQVPPVPYLEPDDELLPEHNTAGCGEGGRGRKLTRSRMFTHHPNVSVTESSATQSDASRSSSIFRFGKSIAASFNPTNWKFWSKEQEEEEEDEEATQLKVLQERQTKAEKIYQELKESGHFRDSAVGPRLFPPASEKKAVKHDSGFEFGDLDTSSRARGITSIEEKRKGRIFLEPPRLVSQRGESPESKYAASAAPSNTSTPNKPKFTFKKPSLANLKKASLSNIKSAFAGDSTRSGNDRHQARRMPSRKDMQKQQKLVKRVSNLEERLKHARQQLAEALNEPLPSGSPPPPQAPPRVGRSRFVPGALSSLPSERLLSGYVGSEAGFSDDDEMHSAIGQAVSTDYAMGSTHYMSGGLGQAVSTDRAVGSNHYMSGGLGSEQSKGIATGSSNGHELQHADTVMQSVEDVEPARDNLQDAETTPTKPKDAEMAEEKDQELTPMPKYKPTEPTKKRKSIFERVPDDGGEYDPAEAEGSDDEDDLTSDILSEISSIASPPKTKTKSTSTTSKISNTTSHSKGPTLMLQHPRKLQKIVQGPKSTTAVPKTSPPQSASSVSSSRASIPAPTRTAPPPPPSSSAAAAQNRATSKNKPRKTPTPIPSTARQQSASPPPSSAIFTGPGLTYIKPSKAHNLTPKAPSASSSGGENRDAYSADSAMSPSIPALPPMPKAVRLASGEVVRVEGMVKGVGVGVKTKTTTVTAASSSGTGVSGGGDPAAGGMKRERTGMNSSSSKQSFEWPDDVF